MSADKMSTVVSSDIRRDTIVNLKLVNELPLRNALQIFDQNGDGKIDVSELQKIVYWYGLWKYASIGLCLIVLTLVWAIFGLTIWAIDLTKEFTVTDGVLTGGDEVVKMSVASTYIPLSWATLLDRRHLDSLESLSIDVTLSSGKFSAGMYHMKVASYLHANSSYLKLFGEDGSRVWVNSGTVVLHHPDAEEAIMVCGAAACNTLAVDVKPEYLQQLVQRSAALFESNREFQLPAAVEGVAINKADAQDGTCMAVVHALGTVEFSQGAGNDFFKSLDVPYAGSQAYRQDRVNGREYLDLTNDFTRRRLQYTFDDLEEGLMVNLRDNGGRTDLAAQHAAQAASDAQEDIEKAIKENSLTRRRLEMHPELIETVSLNAGDFRGRANELASAVAERTPEIKQEFRKTWDDNFSTRRRLADWKTIFHTVNEELQLNPGVTFKQADEADGMEVQDPETGYAFMEGTEEMNASARRRLQVDSLNIYNPGYGANEADNANFVEVADGNDQEYVGTFDNGYGRRRLAQQKIGDLHEMMNDFQVNLNAKAKQAKGDAGALSDIYGKEYAFEEEIKKEAMRVEERRRLGAASAFLDGLVYQGLALEVNPDPVGKPLSNAANAAVKIADIFDPEFIATTEEFSRRRLQDSSDVDLITSVGLSLSDFGSQASDSSDAVTTDEETADPDHAGWWEFGRRRLGDIFNAFTTADLGLNDSGGRTDEEKVKAAYEKAAEKEQAWEATSDKPIRRRLSGLNKIVDPLKIVPLGLHKHFVKAENNDGSLFKKAAEKVSAAVANFGTEFKRRLLDEEPLVQSERRRLLSGHLNLNDKGYYNIKKLMNAALYTPKKEAKAGPAFESDRTYRVDPTRRRIEDESPLQTERRRLPEQPRIMGIGDMGYDIDEQAFAQAQAAQTSAAGGTSVAQAAMAEKNTAVTFEFPRRRLREADDIVEKLAITAITSTVDNFNKISPVLNQFAVQASKAGVPAAAQAANAALNQVVTEFGGRRRLDADGVFKMIKGTDIMNQVESGIDDILADKQREVLAPGAPEKFNRALNGIISSGFRTAPAGSGRRRLDDTTLGNVVTIDMGLSNPGYDVDNQEAEHDAVSSENNGTGPQGVLEAIGVW